MKRCLPMIAAAMLMGCPSEETKNEAELCAESCTSIGRPSGSIVDGNCVCDEAAVDAGNTPADSGPAVDAGAGDDAGAHRDAGPQPDVDAGAQPPMDASVEAGPFDAGPFSNRDIGVIDLDAGTMNMNPHALCPELCQWGFLGWQEGVDGGPGQSVDCPADRELVFGTRSVDDCATACQQSVGNWSIHQFRLLQQCIQVASCGQRQACRPETVEAEWQNPICAELCEGIWDYRAGEDVCEPRRYGEDCPTNCGAELRRRGPLAAMGIQRCYDNMISPCADAENTYTCQCERRADCYQRDHRMAERVAFEYCSLRNTHCLSEHELPMNMIDCIDARMVEVLGHRDLGELQQCLTRFANNPSDDCFNDLDNCLTPF